MKFLSGIRRKRKKMWILKIDFTKAHDFVSWDYLVRIMEFVNFGKNGILGFMHV